MLCTRLCRSQLGGKTGRSSLKNRQGSAPIEAANWTLWLDLSILVRTVKIVLTSRGV